MTTDMDIHTVADFVTARLDEEEADARASIFPGEWAAAHEEVGQPIMAGSYRVATCARSVMAHIARHDPARMLAEIAAKRAIVANMCSLHEAAWQYDDARTDIEHLTLTTVRRFACLDADHPDFDPAWRMKEGQ